jgi:hypothetical protein
MSRFVVRTVVIAMAVVQLGVGGTIVGMGASADAVSPAKQPPGLDHFLCYSASISPAGGGFSIPGKLILKNQFNTTGFVPSVSQSNLVHCNPVQKTVGTHVYPINNPNAHGLCFPITAATQPVFKVQVTNQFGKADLITGQPTGLCLPTWKSLTGPPNMTPNQPPGLDHFVCYPVQYADATRFRIPLRVSLQDEFAAAAVRVKVGAPETLCVPTTKIANGVVYKVHNPRAHYLCFAVSPTPIISPVFDENQFGTAPLTIGQTTTLCLPSFKKIIP